MRSDPRRAHVFKRQLDKRVAKLLGMRTVDVAVITGQFLKEVQRELLHGCTVYLYDLGLIVPHHKQQYLRLLLEPSRILKERASRMMDKYGVKTDEPKKTSNNKCPDCGATAEQHGRVLRCPACGTAPFEKQRKKDEEGL